MRAGCRSRRWPGVTLYGLVILAALGFALALRLRQAPAPMDFDEYASVYFSGRAWSELWGGWMVRETNPPLFYSLLKLWRGVVPASEAALRVLPLLLSLAQIALLGRFVARTYGVAAAVLAIVLLALSPSDIFQSEYVRGYGLAKLAVTVSFIGLVAGLGDERRAQRAAGWAWYVAGAVVAIYAHTTMLLWPPIAALAVLADALAGRDGRRGLALARASLRPLALTSLAIAVLSAWVVWLAFAQLRSRAANIGWIEPLSLADYRDSINLQLLLDGSLSSALMLALIVIGTLRTWRRRVTRLALVIVVATLAGFKLADALHPIVSDYTLHWCMSFTVILAAAALADPPARWLVPAWRRLAAGGLAATVVAGIGWEGWDELVNEVWMVEPQDWRATIATVSKAPGAALLVSHEAIGVVVEQACRLRFAPQGCPFPLIVMANPAQSDNWAFGGYSGAIVPARAAPLALAAARPAVRQVYVFSRYVYTPLVQLGIDARRYRHLQWDDGELIGPIPIGDLTPSRGGRLNPS